MAQKIATCCYCGTRATLVLDKSLHELSCANCGAPLHEFKAIPIHKLQPRDRAYEKSKSRKKPDCKRRSYEKNPTKRYAKKRKSLGRKVLSELWDVAEDIFD
ncbi:hypothetical protein ROA7450_03206 [Roseovarius albus]|uniref:TFIIB zinc-binding protein n=1 Tax=Roseovarius albus TaxID=1247867 RepID=A0A1X6ZUG7_9RHOB|nr:hypothetical protein [Roseovarius albus]SLN61691.1 hypothetical protein ROA7450_03206 [Roseovarius albus]